MVGVASNFSADDQSDNHSKNTSRRASVILAYPHWMNLGEQWGFKMSQVAKALDEVL